ncbi:MAG: hypothetical protein QXR81_07615 [Candidatus Nezhaarchaeales archaeon]
MEKPNVSIPMLIAIEEIKAQLDENVPIVERIKQAMRLALNHWLITDEVEQFNCAIGAVLLTATEEERKPIREEMRFLKALCTAAEGVPVDFTSLTENTKPENWYGLLKLWREVKKEGGKLEG